MADDPTAPTDEPTDEAGGTLWLFLVGVALFVLGLVAFLADLATGHDIVRSLACNAAGAVVLVTWAGRDSYRDADSGVETPLGAVGTGLILVGLYLLLAGSIVCVTSLRHGRLVVGLAMLGAGLPLVLGGFLVFPVDAFVAGDDGEGAEPDTGSDDDGEPA